MKYLRRHNVNPQSFLDDTILQKADGNIEFNPTSDVLINGNLVFGAGFGIPGPTVSNVMYVTLDGNDANDGLGEGPNQAKRTLKAACAVAQQGTTIYVRSGEYEEDNPIRVPPKVSIVGDTLRTTIIRPLNGAITYTITNVARTDEYVTVTTLTNHGLTSADRVRVDCATFPSIDDIAANVIDTPTLTTFRYRDFGTNIASASATGTVKKGFDLFHLNSADYVAQLVIKGLQAPAYAFAIDSDAIVDTSPYVQNCSNINGPWMRNGVEWLPFQTEQPDTNGTMVTGPRPLLDDEIDPTQVNTYGINIEGGGGGMLIDGDKYNSQSPIKSMVGDAFTQVSQGGIGFHITNFGYMQLVSCFAVFCSKAFYTTKGGYLSISNSVCDFGTEAFVADGYYPIPYATGVLNQDYFSTVGSITISEEGAGYTVAPSVTIQPPTTPGGVQATATAVIDPILQKVVSIQVDNAGSGYDFQPTISFSGGGSPTVTAGATVNLSKNLTIDVYEISNKPQIGSIMFLGNDTTAYYISATGSPTFTFRYDEQKCRRDVGYIIDAVLGDTVFNSNHQSVYAGLSYLRSYSSKVTSLQKAQTIAGIQKAKADVLASASVVANATATTRVTSLFNTIVNIINLGTSAAPSINIPFAATREPGFAEAAALLVANKTFIKDEIEAWIAVNFPTFSYDVATCKRDIEYIIDAIAYDLTYEGNGQTRNAALAYAEGSVIAGQIEETQAAYEYWQTIIGRIVKNQTVTASVGNTTPQVSGSIGSPVDPNGPANTAEALLEYVINVVDHGTGYVPELVVLPNYSYGDATQYGIRNTVFSTISTIQESVIDFLNNAYGGSVEVTTFPPIQSALIGTDVRFHNVSTVSTASTAMEYVGTGVTYNALPFFGGEPVPANERIEINNGKCFTVTSDQIGNYRIGEFFSVNAITGEVTIDAENINLQGLAAIGPFKRNGIPVGVQLREVSDNTSLIASNGLQDVNTAPTQRAVAIYVENNYLNKVSSVAQTVQSDIAFIGDVEIRGGDLTTNQTTFNLLNTTATTVNTFGAATTIEIGAATGTLTINNNKVVIDSTGSLQIPVGSIAQRGSTANGQIRYNNELSIFEGYGPGGSWGSLGGVRSVDGLTQITAESAPGASDDILRFYAADVDNVTTKLVVTLNNASLTVLNTTESTDKDTGALIVEGGVGIEKNLNVGGNTSVIGNTTLTGDLAVNGGDLTTTAATFNLVNATATTVNFAGAATTLEIGAATGTTNINNDLDVDGDVNIDGGDLTVSTTTFNLANTTATTVNFAGAGTTVIIGAATGTTSVKHNVEIQGTTLSTTQSTFNLVNATATTVNFAGAGSTINIGSSSGNTNVRNSFNVDINSTLGLNTDSLNIVNGKLTVNLKDNVADIFTVRENTNNYIKINTSNSLELITFGVLPTYEFLNATDATSTSVASTTFAGGVGIAKKLFVGTDLDVDGNATIGDATTDTHTVTGSVAIVAPDNTAAALQIRENAQPYFTVVTTNGSESVTFESIPRVLINNITDSTDKDTGAVVIEGGVGIEKNLNVGGTMGVTGNVTLTGDLAVNGGDITTTATTFNLVNATATTVNFAGAATDVQIGAATGATVTLRPGTLVGSNTIQDVYNTVATTVNAFGAATTIAVGTTSGTITLSNPTVVGTQTTVNLWNTTTTTVNFAGAATTLEIGAATGTTNINNDLDVDGDVNIDGGDLTVSTATFNLANTTATTGNLFGVATAVNVGISAASASTLTYGPAITGNTFKLAGTTVGTINLTTDVTSGTVNAWQSVTGIINFGSSGTINIGNSTTATTAAVVGGAFTGNSLKIAGTAAGTVTLNSDVTTGIVNAFTNVTSGTINLGSATSSVNIGVLALTTDLAVQYGGTGQSSFTTNGVIYGQNTSGLAVTAASVPGSNATTSYGVLTTDVSNVPVWTDTIDGGSY
jgi:hypothetical protein